MLVVRLRVLTRGLASLLTPAAAAATKRPASSAVLSAMLKNAGLPHWTAFYVPRHQVCNDLWGWSHFNHEVDGTNYHVLRTGAFPFVKFHCSKRPPEDLRIEDAFYRVLKVLNLGLPTLAYGLAGLLMASHTEEVVVEGSRITLYFWYEEDRGSPN